ncbi:MAG: hypothetical protein IVW51_08595 [Thermaceae bacterium]|nr:hypothetical protein [Thermaceae bacterium]
MFAKGDCLPCPLKQRCSRSPNQGKQLNLRPREQFEAREYIDSETEGRCSLGSLHLKTTVRDKIPLRVQSILGN